MLRDYYCQVTTFGKLTASLCGCYILATRMERLSFGTLETSRKGTRNGSDVERMEHSYLPISLTVPSTTGIAVCPCLAVTHNEIALTTPGKFPQCTLNYMNSLFSEF